MTFDLFLSWFLSRWFAALLDIRHFTKTLVEERAFKLVLRDVVLKVLRRFFFPQSLDFILLL